MHVHAHVYAYMCVVYVCVNTHMHAPQVKSALLKSNGVHMVSSTFHSTFPWKQYTYVDVQLYNCLHSKEIK